MKLIEIYGVLGIMISAMCLSIIIIKEAVKKYVKK